MDIQIITTIIAPALGVFGMISIIIVFIMNKGIKVSSLGLAVISLIFVGFPLWKNIAITLDETGVTAKLEVLEEQVAEAKSKAEHADQIAKTAIAENMQIKQVAIENAKLTSGLKTDILTLRGQNLILKEQILRPNQSHPLIKEIMPTGALSKDAIKSLKLNPSLYSTKKLTESIKTLEMKK